MNEGDVLLKEVLDNLSEPGPKGVYGDWLADAGRHELAHAYHWAERRGKYPRHTAAGYSWGQTRTEAPDEHWLLPPIVYQVVSPSGQQVHFASVPAAFEALAAALRTVRDQVEVFPLG